MRYQGLIDLANRVNAPLLVFDLEATAFRGRSNFGITEFAGLLVYPNGKQVWLASLVNPENPIDANVVALTGITQEMVEQEEPWGHRLAGLLDYYARNAVVVGFNSKAFDCPAVVEQNARYGHLTTQFTRTLDVKSLAKSLWDLSGTLVAVAEQFGLQPDGQLHRAQADVSLTARVLNAMALAALDRVAAAVAPLKVTETVDKGVAACLRSELVALNRRGRAWSENADAVDPATAAVPPLKAAKAEASPTQTAQRVARVQACLADATVTTLADLTARVAETPEFSNTQAAYAVGFALGSLIDQGEVSAIRFTPAPLLAWLEQTIPQHQSAWEQDGRRLKALMERLQQHQPPETLDYITLRGGLEQLGLSWSARNR